MDLRLKIDPDSYRDLKIAVQLLKTFAVIALLSAIFSSCDKETNVTYGVNEEDLIPPASVKIKGKSETQYVSILYANLFQQALSPANQVEIKDLIVSFGDKDLIHEIIISNFMNESGVLIPDDSLMRADVEAFIDETYERFYIRPATELEKTYFKNYLEANPHVTPELVYFAFAMSNEYYYY